MKIQTVCDNRVFGRAYRKGQKRAGRYVVVYVIKGRHKECRLGLTVTKSRGPAVVRNRIKRIIRAAFCDVAKRYGLSGGCDVIIVARDAAAEAKSTQIVPELEEMLVKLGVAVEKHAETETETETETVANAVNAADAADEVDVADVADVADTAAVTDTAATAY